MTDVQQLARRRTAADLCRDGAALLSGLVAHAKRATSLPGGARFSFAPTAERLRQIAAVAERENECGSFLSFRVGLSAEPAVLSLDVTGPEGTTQLLASLFELANAA